MDLSPDARAELLHMANSRDVPANVAVRAKVVLWRCEGYRKKDIARLAGLSRPTVDRWLGRYETDGLDGLLDRPSGLGRVEVSGRIRARILAVTQVSPPPELGLSKRSKRGMAD